MATVTVKEALSPTQKKVFKLLKWVNRLSFLGIILMVFMTYLHYTNGGPEPFIKLTESTYSELYGIAVADLGLALFLVIWVIGRAMAKNYKFYKIWKWLRPFRMFWLMFFLIDAGVLASGFLIYFGIFKVEVICPMSWFPTIILLIQVFTMLSLLSAVDEGNSNPNVCEFC